MQFSNLTDQTTMWPHFLWDHIVLFWSGLREGIPVIWYWPTSILHVAQKCPESVIISLSVPIPQAQRIADRVHLQLAFAPGGLEPEKVSIEKRRSLNQFSQPGRRLHTVESRNSKLNFVTKFFYYCGIFTIQHVIYGIKWSESPSILVNWWEFFYYSEVY